MEMVQAMRSRRATGVRVTTYRCTRCHIVVRNAAHCPYCRRLLEPVPPKRLARPATPTSDQLAINEELETFDEWVRGLSAEGGQAR